MRNDLKYRDYTIQPGGHWPEHGWSFQHNSYDGPGDNRCGSAVTIEGCIEQIDELYLDDALEVLAQPFPGIAR